MQKFNWNLEPSSEWVLDVDSALVVADARGQQKCQHTWPLVTIQAYFRYRIKIVIVTFLSHNSDLCYWSLHLAIQILSKLWDAVNSQLQEKNQNSEIKSQLLFIFYIPWQK